MTGFQTRQRQRITGFFMAAGKTISVDTRLCVKPIHKAADGSTSLQRVSVATPSVEKVCH